MSYALQTHSELNGFSSGDRFAWGLTSIFSVLCHIVLIAAMAWIGDLMPRRVEMPEVISVNMVSFPSAEPAPAPKSTPKELTVIKPEDLARAREAAEPVPEDTTPVEPLPPETSRAVAETARTHEPVVKPNSSKTVVLPDAEPEQPAVEKTPPATKPVEPAPPQKITALKPKAAAKPKKTKEKALTPENVQQESLQSALDRLRRENADRSPSPAPTSRNSSGTGSSPTGAGASSGISDIYKAQLISRILGNWTAPEQLLSLRRDLTAVISVQLAPNGGIRHIEMRRRSGNPHLDDTAYRAVLKAAPFPPPPEHMRPDTLFTFRFTPMGLQQ